MVAVFALVMVYQVRAGLGGLRLRRQHYRKQRDRESKAIEGRKRGGGVIESV